MRYLIQVRFNDAGAVIAALPPDAQAEVTAEFQAIRPVSCCSAVATSAVEEAV